MNNQSKLSGSNQASYELACKCKSLGLTFEQAVDEVTRQFPHLSEREVHRRTGNAYREKSRKSGPPRPKPNRVLINSILEHDEALASSERLLGEINEQQYLEDLSTLDVLSELFLPEEIVCLVDGRFSSETRPLSEIHHVGDTQCMVVPNAMSAIVGFTKEGNRSPRALGNSCHHRKYLVVEFDHAKEKEQLIFISYLKKLLPLKMAVHSGGKSIHSWFWAEHLTERDQWEFFRIALSLGADPALWTPNQPTRLPNAVRTFTDRPDSKQRLLYINPRINRKLT